MGFFQGKRRALFVGDPVLNEWRHGIILSFEEKQKKDFYTGEPVYWPKSGNEKMQYEVELQTDYRDPDDPLDDGKRWVFIEKVGYKQVGSLYRETLDAIKAAGGPMDLEVGAKFACMIVELVPNDKNPKNPYKRWKVAYQRPDEASFFKNDEADQEAPAQPPNWQPGARQPANGGSGTSSSPAATTAAPTGTPEDDEFAAFQAWRRQQTQRAAQLVATSDKPAADEPPPWEKADQAVTTGSRSPFA